MSSKKNELSAVAANERRALVFRTAVFGIAVTVLAVISGFFVFDVLTQNNNVELSLSGFYTVRVVQMPDAQSQRLIDLKGILPRLLGLSPEDFFISSTGEGEVVLCAGRFESSVSEQVVQLLSTVRSFEYEGERVFEEADIWYINTDRD